MGISHEHTYLGQKLRHSHPGGNVQHGYYEHPEDGFPYPAELVTEPSGTPLADALALVDRMQAAGGEDLAALREDWLASGEPVDSELAALRELAEAVRAHGLNGMPAS
jgi:hypothetical protein